MRILIFGAGVIGSLYGALFAEAGYDVYVYARGRRLESLTQDGLLYKGKRKIRKAPIKLLLKIEPGDRYDLVFLAVRENQLHTALEELRQNCSPTIVTMVNSLETYDQWEAICGAGRIIPAFPGAGGGFDGSVLDASLTPRLIQPTTFGKKTEEKESFHAFSARRRSRIRSYRTCTPGSFAIWLWSCRSPMHIMRRRIPRTREKMSHS